jgi:hypothetical protein
MGSATLDDRAALRLRLYCAFTSITRGSLTVRGPPLIGQCAAILVNVLDGWQNIGRRQV